MRRTQRVRVGVSKALAIDFDFPETGKGLRSFNRGRVPYGAVRSPKGSGYVWTVVIRSEGARALRIYFTDFELPVGAEVYVYNDTGQAFGPYTGLGPLDEGEFWSHTVFGSEVIVQLHYAPSRRAKSFPPRFQIAEIGHLGPEFQLAPDPQAGANNECHTGQGDGCLLNVECAADPAVNDARDAVALIVYRSKGFLWQCSGGLLTDTDAATHKPFFLTANHCISRGREARSVEAFPQFYVGCDQPCANRGGFSRVLGASLLSTGKGADHTLLLLDDPAPGGSAFLGWNSNPVAFNNTLELFRVSHPLGLPQAYSKHSVDTGAPVCSSWPRGNRIYSRDEMGATEGGSSGSPVVNEAGQVVGQLSGACGFNVGDSCDNALNATVDGAFAAYYDDISQWLTANGGGEPPPEGGGCELGQSGDSCSADDQCCSGKCRGKKNRKTCR